MTGLVELEDGVWCLAGGVNSGLVLTDSGLVAIDTGLDRGAANRILRAAEQIGRPIEAVVNTHAHADHHGGNAQLVRRLGVPVYAPAVEEAVIREPRYEPIYLFGGAAPIAALRNRFLQAEPSPVDHVFSPGDTLLIGGRSLHVVGLAGHSIAQAGIRAGSVLFAADSFFGLDALGKHGVPYLVDAGEARATLERLRGDTARWFVPGHGEPLADPAATLDANHDVIERTLGWLAERLAHGPAATEDLLADLAATFDLKVEDATGFVLYRATLLGYLTTLERHEAARAVVEAGRWRWTGGG